MTAATVAGFILLNRGFPRSVATCTRTIRSLLDDLNRDAELSAVTLDRSALQDLEGLVSLTIGEAIDRGLHDHLDHMQLALQTLVNALATVYFDTEENYRTQSQMQTQSMG
jgi:uncharacterized alpha-E superfamily protein